MPSCIIARGAEANRSFILPVDLTPPAYKLCIDFGPGVGVRRSAAQITTHYTTQALVGSRVMAVVNFPPRQIGPVRSEVLVLGFPDADGAIVLARPDRDAPNGARLA